MPAITQDSTPPALPIISSPSAAVTVDTATAAIAGTAEAGSFVQVYDGGDQVVGSEQLSPGQTSYSIAVSLISNAPNAFFVTATDAAGNQSPTAVAPTITQDSIAPAAPTVTSPADPVTVNTPTATIAGTAEAGSFVQVYDDGDQVVGSQQLSPGQTSYSVSVPLISNAPNAFFVTSTDAGGNESLPAFVPTITQDSVPPALPVVTSPASATTLNAGSSAISGTAEAASLVHVYRDSNGDGVIDVGDSLVGSEQLDPGQSSYSITVPLNPNQPNYFLVTSTDAGGNLSAPAVVPTITQDSIPPIAPALAAPAGPIAVNTGTTTLTGTAEAGSLVQVYADTNGDGIIDDGEQVVGFEQLDPGQTSYSITVPLVPNAANHFLITATDAGGNQSCAGRGADDHAGLDRPGRANRRQPGRPRDGEHSIHHADRHGRGGQPGEGLCRRQR